MGIASDIKKLGEDIVASYDMRINALGTLVKDVHKTLKGFASDRKEMSANQSKALSDFVADLTKNVGHMISGFQKDHKAMANTLNDSLEKGETERLKSFKDMMGTIKKGIKDIETYVANKLKEFNNAHADMSEALKKELAKFVGSIVSETKKLLAGYNEENKEMAANWKTMTETMAKRRAKSAVSAGTEITTVEKAIEKPKKKRGRKKGKKS